MFLRKYEVIPSYLISVCLVLYLTCAQIIIQIRPLTTGYFIEYILFYLLLFSSFSFLHSVLYGFLVVLHHFFSCIFWTLLVLNYFHRNYAFRFFCNKVHSEKTPTHIMLGSCRAGEKSNSYLQLVTTGETVDAVLNRMLIKTRKETVWMQLHTYIITLNTIENFLSAFFSREVAFTSL